MSGQSLLVTFCMQLASPLQSGGLLALDGEGFSWLPLAGLEFPKYANGGLCGACRVPGGLVLATQSTPPLLVLYDTVAGRIKARRDLSPALDLHSVVYRAGALYVGSTGTNEIYEVPLDNAVFGEPRVHWRYPGVDHDRDLVHLNGLTVSEEGLIASCFGPRQQDGSWGNAGAVFQVAPYQVIQDGLCQPHSPLCDNDRLFFAESRSHRLHLLHHNGPGGWRREPVIDVGGYARGLACQGHRLWVGLSAPRRISRSKGTPNQGVDTNQCASVICIDLATRTIIDRRALDGLGDEVYDLLILDETGPPGRYADALIQRIASVQAMVDTIRRDYIETSEKLGDMMEQNEVNRVRAAGIEESLQAEQANTEKLLGQLHAEQLFAQRLSRQLQVVTGSRLWRAAQWLRRLVGRAPFVPDLNHPFTPVEVPVAAPVEAPAAVPAATPRSRSMTEVFREIYVKNHWGSEVSRSGTGSDLQQTAVIRETLPPLLRELGVGTMLDVPCGDHHWMGALDLDVDYTGADVVPDLIAANTARYGNDRHRFQVVDVANDALPRVDLIFCRDLLVHFSFADALRAIANLKRSGSIWLLTTTFTNRTDNVDIETGEWRAINLQLPPFNFPAPVRMINENCTEFGTDWADKSLGLWRLADL